VVHLLLQLVRRKLSKVSDAEFAPFILIAPFLCCFPNRISSSLKTSKATSVKMFRSRTETPAVLKIDLFCFVAGLRQALWKVSGS
jgi:hypothetical protein